MNPYIPIVVIALELGTPVDRLAARLGDQIQTDASGLRVVTREACARIIEEHCAAIAEQARRTREWQAEQAAKS